MSANAIESPVVSRRSFLRSGVSAALIVTRAVAETGVRISPPAIALGLAATETPPVEPLRSNPDGRLIYPGSLEDRAVASGVNKFIDPVKGYFPLVRAVVMNNPDVLFVTQQTFALVYKAISEGKRPLAGELFRNGYRQSLDRITADPSRIVEGTNIHLEAIHQAVYAVTAYATPWFTLQEYKDMKLIPNDTPPTKKVSTLFWRNEDGIGKLAYPRFCGDKTAVDPSGEEGADHGEDGTMHVTGHTIVTFLDRYLNSQRVKHSLGGAYPNPIRSLITAGKLARVIRNPDEEAIALSNILSWGYEILSTVWPPENLERTVTALKSGKRTYQGLVDPDSIKDRSSNTIGAQYGIALYKAGEEEISIKGPSKYLDLPRYRNTNCDPHQRPLMAK